MKATGVALTNAVLVVVLVLGNATWSRAQWQTAHGNPANTGFARVNTLPATFSSNIGFANVGFVAPGANPVTGPDGTVYIGNVAGELIALHPNGTPYWTRTINPEHGGIFSSPAVGADGSIYVVSTASIPRSGGKAPLHAAFLHKFSPGGGWYFFRSFPIAPQTPFDGGATTAPPNIWVWNGMEVIMVPVAYSVIGGTEVRLLAFSTAGNVLARMVSAQYFDLTGGSWGPLQTIVDMINCLPQPNCGFNASGGELSDVWPQPGVAIYEYPNGSPYIWVADGVRNTVAYKFEPEIGFTEIYRFTDVNDRLSSPPVALNNVVAAVGTEDGRLKFERGNFVTAVGDPVSAAPTRLYDGRLAVIGRSARLLLIKSHSIVMQQPLNGVSIASAAASCTHLFVSSSNELVTFDVKTMTPVARLPWTEGGRHAPVIGPSGHVYAMTNFGLFVFKAPSRLPVTTFSTFGTACDQVATRGGALFPGMTSTQ